MKIHIAIILCVIYMGSMAQEPVQWTFTTKKTADQQVEVHLLAKLKPGWHLYAGIQPENAIAEPTKIVFMKNPLFRLSGGISEYGNKQLFENREVGISAYQYEEQVDFVQLVLLRSKAKANIHGSITYEVCTNEKCLPAKTIPFNLPLF